MRERRERCVCGGWECRGVLEDWCRGDGDAEVGRESDRKGEEPGDADEAHYGCCCG